jgi:hypothetical protein
VEFRTIAESNRLITRSDEELMSPIGTICERTLP